MFEGMNYLFPDNVDASQIGRVHGGTFFFVGKTFTVTPEKGKNINKKKR